MIRVYLAEDDPAALALLDAYFSAQERTEVCGCADNGRQALEGIRRLQPDLLVLDMIMPVMSGLAVLRELEANPPPVRPKILVISRVSDDEIVSRAFALGVSYYLLKPFQFAEFPELLSALFGKRNAGPAAGRAGWLLERMGASTQEAGYRSAVMVSEVLAGNPDLLLKEAYFFPVQALKTSYDCVEKNIRTLVNKLHRIGSPAYHSMMGGIPIRRPANDLFLRRLAETLRES